MAPKIKIVQPTPPAPEITAEVLATAIRDLAEGMRKLNRTPLKRSAIEVLIHHHSGIAMGTVRVILNNIEELDKIWLKEKK